MLSQHPDKYELKLEYDGYRFYIPVKATDYHTHRYVEALNQQIYSNAGATPEVLIEVMNIIISKCNDEKDIKTLRTDIAALANSIVYRTKYPVDQTCALRMGAILTFMEYDHEGKLISEDPDKPDWFWINKKVQLALNNPELYTFFLTWGVANTPKYRELLDTLNDRDYFSKRMEAIMTLLPQSIKLSAI